VTGCYGDPIVQTPNLDRLASQGIVFENAYTTSPLCVPARQSFTAGKYASRVSAWNNHRMMPPDSPSLPRLLNACGYQSVLVGKMHYDQTCRYGFEELPTKSNNGIMMGTGKRRLYDDTSTNPKSWESRAKSFVAGEDSRIISHDKDVTRQASEFLGKRKKDDPPFFLLAGYLAPHFPLTVPEEYLSRYRGKVPMPNIPEGLIEQLPTNYKHIRMGFGVVDTDPETVQLGRECYWAFVNWMDDQVGELLRALEQSEVGQDTVVIYMTDHGENKGDHGMWWKSCMYEHAAGIPLIISCPGRLPQGQRRRGACSSVDVVQTIADIAGADSPADWDGDSLLPWIEDPQFAWKDFALSEYYAHFILSGFTMVRQGKYKYVYHARWDEKRPPELELYDMEQDPGELENLIGDPHYADTAASMHARMIKELGEHPDDIEKRAVKELAQGYNRPEKGKAESEE
ncbi:MAG TPA: sulfatase-like hydrolase/transferase, partial [bacterium]|nr:sulfatase-like hydrolase/transferase [bacterium]